MHIAVKKRRERAEDVEALLAGGADPCVRDRKRNIPIYYSKEGSRANRLLYSAGGIDWDCDEKAVAEAPKQQTGKKAGGGTTPSVPVSEQQRKTASRVETANRYIYRDTELLEHQFSSVNDIDPNKLFYGGDEFDYREITNGVFQVCLYDSILYTREVLPMARNNVEIARNNVEQFGIEGSDKLQRELDKWKKTVGIFEAVERGEGLILMLHGDPRADDNQLSQCRKNHKDHPRHFSVACDCFPDWESLVRWLNETVDGYR